MLDLKISIVTVFLLSLIIPFLIKPINVNGLYDTGELTSLRAYCFLHADRAAQGENVVNDLIKSGLANSTYYDWSCSKIDETLEAEEQAEERAAIAQAEAEAQKRYDFSWNCWKGNLTPSQLSECMDADKPTDGPHCLYDEDVENWEKYYTESEWNSGRYHLTPEETSECKNAGLDGFGGFRYLDEDEDEDEDTKE